MWLGVQCGELEKPATDWANRPFYSRRLDPMTTNNTTVDQAAASWFALDDQIAVVTGASSGLGRHFASVLALNGCKVALLARRQERLEELATDLEKKGATAKPFAVDVTDDDAVRETFDKIKLELGTVSVLVNNAGIGLPGSFLDEPAEQTSRVFNVNQQAVWNVAQEAARQMVEAGNGGSIINIASILGLRVLPGASSYAVSKAAVIQMTKSIALELARYNVRANAIAPGYFATEMNDDFLASKDGEKILRRSPMRRAGQYEELDGVLLLLASSRSSFMTGAVIPVDGGHLISSL